MARNENLFTNLSKSFRDELESIVKQVMAKHDVSPTSDISKSIEFTTQNSRDSLFMLVNDYFQPLSKGRKKNIRKVPIARLIEFIKKQNIRSSKYSTTQLAFAMQRSIYVNGIQGKNFIEAVTDSVTDRVELVIADELEELIADSLFSAFKVTTI